MNEMPNAHVFLIKTWHFNWFFFTKKNDLRIYAAEEIEKLLKMKQFSTNKDKDFIGTIVNPPFTTNAKKKISELIKKKSFFDTLGQSSNLGIVL